MKKKMLAEQEEALGADHDGTLRKVREIDLLLKEVARRAQGGRGVLSPRFRGTREDS